MNESIGVQKLHFIDGIMIFFGHSILRRKNFKGFTKYSRQKMTLHSIMIRLITFSIDILL